MRVARSESLIVDGDGPISSISKNSVERIHNLQSGYEMCQTKLRV
jgi:hypothetical protein